MNPKSIGGIVLIVAGIALFIVGLNASDSVADRMSNFFTGRFTDKTVWYMVGGGVIAIAGVALATLGSRRFKA